MPQYRPNKHPNYQARPVLTLYRDGYANLNGEAARELATDVAALRLFAPASLDAPYWHLLALTAEIADAPALTDSVSVCRRHDRLGHLRFRCCAMSTALFACLPEGTRQLRLELTPATHNRFQLLPIG
jgi:hypothetical protein